LLLASLNTDIEHFRILLHLRCLAFGKLKVRGCDNIAKAFARGEGLNVPLTVRSFGRRAVTKELLQALRSGYSTTGFELLHVSDLTVLS
jgi:hypothetical protein